LPEPVIARAKAILDGLERGATVSGGVPSHPAALRPQLDLFAAPGQDKPNPVIETLRALDVDRLTPLEALSLVARLQKVITGPTS